MNDGSRNNNNNNEKMKPMKNKITKKQQIVDKIKCQICNINQAKYKCPKCFIETCCLKCVKVHKVERKCDGKRDPGKYISIQAFQDRDLHRDYHFLEGLKQVAESSKRKLVKICGFKKNKNNNNKRRKKHNNNTEIVGEKFIIVRGTREKLLLNAAKTRNIRLTLLSHGMERRKINTSWYKKNVNKIFWKIKWTFINVKKYNNDNNNDDDDDVVGSFSSSSTTTTKNVVEKPVSRSIVTNAAFIYQDGIDETKPLIDCLKENFEISLKNSNTRVTLRRFCTSTSCYDNLKLYLQKERLNNSNNNNNTINSVSVNDDVDGNKRDDDDDDTNNSTNTSNNSDKESKKYVVLDSSKPLKELLENEIVVEFPNILVYLNGEHPLE